MLAVHMNNVSNNVQTLRIQMNYEFGSGANLVGVRVNKSDDGTYMPYTFIHFRTRSYTDTHTHTPYNNAQ